MSSSALLGVDLGTTRCKAGLFDLEGRLLRLASRQTATHRTSEGHLYHDPEELWQTAASAIREVADGSRVEVVGVASMAEAGLLVDRATGAARTHVLPWYDRRAAPQAEAIAREGKPLELFQRTGLYPSFKYGLPKLLWLRARDPSATEGSIWLSVADYVVYRLTGCAVTAPSLAAWTYAFGLAEQAWDEAWIRHFGLDPSLFPEVLPSGRVAGTVTLAAAEVTGLPAGTRRGAEP